MSRFIFGPFCAQMLADIGRGSRASVRPLEGRQWVAGDISPSFLARNRNKRSLAMDMRKPEAQDIALKLALQSDVLLHNFRPGIMGRMGLDAAGGAQSPSYLLFLVGVWPEWAIGGLARAGSAYPGDVRYCRDDRLGGWPADTGRIADVTVRSPPLIVL